MNIERQINVSDALATAIKSLKKTQQQVVKLLSVVPWEISSFSTRHDRHSFKMIYGFIDKGVFQSQTN